MPNRTEHRHWAAPLQNAIAAYAAYKQRRAAGTAEAWPELLAAQPTLAELLQDLRDGEDLDDTPRPAAEAATSDPLGPSRSGLDNIDRFELIRVLGSGGYGIVYLARDPKLDRAVALKLLNVAFGDEARTVRFGREARALSGLNHPGICQIYDVDLRARQPWLAMQFVAGVTLAQQLAAHGAQAVGPELIAARAGVLEKAARALQHAHERGFVHRDVKPSNLMVQPDGEPVWLDFGLVRDTSTDDVVTLSGLALGTPQYMAPERHAAGACDARADVWSLGVVLYECLTGQRPFQPKPGETLAEVIRAGVRVEAHRHDRAVPLELAQIAAKAMRPHPADRYQSAAEFADDLRRWRAREPVSARQQSLGLRALRWSQRQPLAAALIGCLSIACAAIGGLGWHASAVATRESRARRQLDVALADARSKAARLAFDSATRDASYGRWELAEQGYRRAADLGHDPIAIELGRIEQWDATFQWQLAQPALQALARHADLGEHTALVALLRNDPTRRGDGDVPEDWRTNLRAIVDSPALPRGWSAYAQALLAESLPNARANLDEALRSDPRHRPANEMRWPIVLLTEGPAAALVEARRFVTLYPQDPLAGLLEYASWRLLGREDAAAQVAVAQALPLSACQVVACATEFRGEVAGAMQTLVHAGMERYLGIDTPLEPKLQAIVRRMSAVIQRFAGLEELTFSPRFPPAMTKVVRASFAGITAALVGGSRRAMDRVIDDLPLGPFYLFRANQCLAAGDLDQAWADLERTQSIDLFGLDQPIAVFRVGTALARHGATLERAPERAEAARRDAAQTIADVLAMPAPLDALTLRYLASRALDLGEVAQAHECIGRLRRCGDDADGQAQAAALLLRAGTPAAAREAATLVLSRHPGHALAQSVADHAGAVERARAAPAQPPK